jgi:hypothetical protein
MIHTYICSIHPKSPAGGVGGESISGDDWQNIIYIHIHTHTHTHIHTYMHTYIHTYIQYKPQVTGREGGGGAVSGGDWQEAVASILFFLWREDTPRCTSASPPGPIPGFKIKQKKENKAPPPKKNIGGPESEKGKCHDVFFWGGGLYFPFFV